MAHSKENEPQEAKTPASDAESSTSGHQAAEPRGRSIPTPSEILPKLPSPQREQIEQFFAASMSYGNPIAGRLTPQHITDLIALSGKQTDLEFNDRRHSRTFGLALVVSVLTAVLALAALLAFLDMPDLLGEVLKAIAVGVGGFGGGYGFSEWRRRRD